MDKAGRPVQGRNTPKVRKGGPSKGTRIGCPEEPPRRPYTHVSQLEQPPAPSAVQAHNRRGAYRYLAVEVPNAGYSKVQGARAGAGGRVPGASFCARALPASMTSRGCSGHHRDHWYHKHVRDNQGRRRDSQGGGKLSQLAGAATLVDRE